MRFLSKLLESFDYSKSAGILLNMMFSCSFIILLFTIFRENIQLKDKIEPADTLQIFFSSFCFFLYFFLFLLKSSKLTKLTIRNIWLHYPAITNGEKILLSSDPFSPLFISRFIIIIILSKFLPQCFSTLKFFVRNIREKKETKQKYITPLRHVYQFPQWLFENSM